MSHQSIWPRSVGCPILLLVIFLQGLLEAGVVKVLRDRCEHQCKERYYIHCAKDNVPLLNDLLIESHTRKALSQICSLYSRQYFTIKSYFFKNVGNYFGRMNIYHYIQDCKKSGSTISSNNYVFMYICTYPAAIFTNLLWE